MAALDPVFGLHAEAMAIQRRRMEVLAANIANADTPAYKARDLDFAKLLAQAGGAGDKATTLSTTHAHHIGGSGGNLSGVGSAAELMYRVATQPSADGNTVDVQVEQAKFAEAALHYQASLNFADGRIRGLMTAITGQ